MFEGYIKSPTSNLYLVNRADAKGVFQVYTTVDTVHFTCLTCTQQAGGPNPAKQHLMVSWHPSGQWIVAGVEQNTHDLQWLPESYQLGLMQSGIWLNMWITDVAGDHWHQLTNYTPANGPARGFVGTPFTRDGKTAAWTEIVNGDVLLYPFGQWRLYKAAFLVTNGMPSLTEKTDITPAGANWVEPGNFSPDGSLLLLSTDIGLNDAHGQDQWTLNIATGALKNLTNSPTVWDEHGLFSSDGSKIVFMSSYPYKAQASSDQVWKLKTEFMIMDSDGGNLEQLTHFNVTGFPESRPGNTVAAVAGFENSQQLFATVMGPNFSKTNWVITLAGKCDAD